MAYAIVFLLTPTVILLCALAVFTRAIRVFVAVPISLAAAYLGSPYLDLIERGSVAILEWVFALAVLSWIALKRTKRDNP